MKPVFTPKFQVKMAPMKKVLQSGRKRALPFFVSTKRPWCRTSNLSYAKKNRKEKEQSA